MSNKKDFATSTVLTAPSPADSGTSLVVQSGHGARFPAAPFYITAHPPSELPTLDNAEKILVTAKSTDTFTLDRAEGDTAAQDIEPGWRVSNALFLDDMLTDAEREKLGYVTVTQAVNLDTMESDIAGKQPLDSDLTTIAGLADPNADGILFWDDSAGAYAYLDASTGLTISGTSMTARTASASQTGIVELATTAETETGTDATRAVTPDGLNDMTTLAGKAWFLDQDDMSSNDATKVASQQSIKAYVDAAMSAAKEALLPVGSIVVLGVATNPATLYGFGTWTAIEGKVLVGKAASGTFGTLDATGGAETHTLTTDEMPSHNHNAGILPSNAAAGSSRYWFNPSGTTNGTNFSYSLNVGNTGNGQAHNNLQPYIVKYMWQRTA